MGFATASEILALLPHELEVLLVGVLGHNRTVRDGCTLVPENKARSLLTQVLWMALLSTYT